MKQKIRRWFRDRVLDGGLMRLIRHIDNQRGNVVQVLTMRAIQRSADYAESRMAGAMAFERRERLWDHALSKGCLDGIYAEFGVWKGASINYMAARRPEQVFNGFDSFEGLQEDWSGRDMQKGHFSLGGHLPPVRSNVKLIKGWYSDTVPGFLRDHPGPLAFLHIDCDTYETTRDLLALLGPRLVPGTVIVFDEYFGFHGWEHGEWCAWQEFGRAYTYLGFSKLAVAIRVE